MKRILSCVGLLFLLAAGPASANVIFTFSGVTFDDGGTLTGTFTTNDALDTLIDFDITTSGANGFHYTSGTSDGITSTSLPFILVANTPPLFDNIIQITFSGGLTPTGAPITIDPFDSFEDTTGSGSRDITAGSVIVATTVPEPSTIALFGVGVLALAVLLAVRRRRKD
jgi:hypothetical protein